MQTFGRIREVYESYADEPGFSKVVPYEAVQAANHSLAINQYVRKTDETLQGPKTLSDSWDAFEEAIPAFWGAMDSLVETLERIEVIAGGNSNE